MITPNLNSLCKQAELYYYDFISNESCEPVPEFIVNHIRECQHCREQVNQLNSVLFQTEGYVEPGQSQVSHVTAALLKLHFAYIGKRVTCNTVRPFLPGLLEPALEIKIPTPITTHLDDCPQCSEDLNTIRELNLSSKQLRRLSQLFAEKPGNDNVSGSQAQAAILAVVSMAFRETDAETLKHLCVCPDCREVLYQYRETVRKECLHNEAEREKFRCEAVSASDIFDYVIPYGLDPAKDQYANFRQSLIFHMRTCPTCLDKMQQLHKTIYGISERAESEVITVYRIDESAKTEAINESDKLYAGFPIRVEVANREDKVQAEQSARTIDFAAIPKQKVSPKKLKPLFRNTLAAAAVILVGITLLLNIPTAKAATLDQIYKAIEKIKNVHISTFAPDKKEPVQEQWVSRTLNVNIVKTEKESILWDIPNKVKKAKRLGNNLVETTMLPAEMVTNLQNTITGSWGLMPFNDISEIPKGASWNRVDDKNQQITSEIEVYDLTWSAKAFNGSVVFYKWRVFVDSKTNLPRRVEFYQKISDAEYNSARVVEYLSDSKMQEVIKEISF